MPLCKWSKDGICTTYRWKGGDPLKCPARTMASCLGLVDELEDILIDPRLRLTARERRETRRKYVVRERESEKARGNSGKVKT